MEMAQNVAKNINVTSVNVNHYELLAWLNETLQTGFTKIEQVCTGRSTIMVLCFNISCFVYVDTGLSCGCLVSDLISLLSFDHAMQNSLRLRQRHKYSTDEINTRSERL